LCVCSEEVFVSIEGQYRAGINYEEDIDGVTSFSYRPSHPGFYVIVVMYNGKHVEGSPFTVKCGGEGHEAIERAMLTESTEQVPTVMADEKVSLAMCLPWVNAEAMRATVMAPDRSLLDARLQLMGNSLCLVKFKPVVEGVHVVSLFRNRRHITGMPAHSDLYFPGSPFEFTVGSLEESGAHKVRIGGIGLEVGETNEIRSFNIYAREAGEGKLQVSVEGPSKAQMDIYEREVRQCEFVNGIYHFQYSVSAPGWYVISVSFNDEDVPDSPFKVFICGASEAGSTDKALAVEGPLRVGEECALSLTLDTKPALLETKLLSPNGAIHKVDVVNSEAAVGRYELRFIPQEIGIYLLELFVDGSPLRSSPLPLHIEAAEVVDASLVTVHGDGVRLAHTGRQSQFTVDSRHAGSGELYLEFVGPSKVAADAHQAIVSPYLFISCWVNMASHLEGACAMEKVIKLKGDASKVTCSGEGLAKFLPGQQASFTVDTSSAGVDVLTVGAVTASGPCEYIKTTHVGEGRYAVAYRIGEPTVGFIFVEYGGVDIPGSPFRINC
uniref:Filamin-A n=1 Tax=Toxocara canis TaxID=6265 RepID=A0A183V7Z8_TOXCA